jgi:hypothetical protein
METLGKVRHPCPVAHHSEQSARAEWLGPLRPFASGFALGFAGFVRGFLCRAIPKPRKPADHGVSMSVTAENHIHTLLWSKMPE